MTKTVSSSFKVRYKHANCHPAV